MGQYEHFDGTAFTAEENAAEDARRAQQRGELDKRNAEAYARRIAAKALQKDEPWGQKLEEAEWKPYLPQGERWVQFRVTQRQNGYGNVTIEGTCPQDGTAEDVRAIFYHWYFGGRGEWAKDGQFGCTIHTD